MSGGVKRWCSDLCTSLYFGLSLKCLWNVVPDQHTGTIGLTLLSKLSSSLILLCRSFGFHIFCFVSILNSFIQMFGESKLTLFYLLFVSLKAVVPAAFCLNILGFPVLGFYDPNTLLLLLLFLSHHSAWGQASFRLSHDQIDLAFQNQMQINFWEKRVNS